MKTNSLPKYWIVRGDNSQLFKDEVAKYLKDEYGANFSGDAMNYYGYDGQGQFYQKKESFKNNPTELSLEEFIKLKNEIIEWAPKKGLQTKFELADGKKTYGEYKLPENWYIKITEENREVIKNWFDKVSGYDGMEYSLGAAYGEVDGEYEGKFNTNEAENWEEITFEQFKKYVLIKSNKIIIGYKLIKPEYEAAACNIGFSSSDIKKFDKLHQGNFCINSTVYQKLQKAGVLDLWFEPVYKPESIIVIVGTSKIPVAISKGKIIVEENNELSLSKIESILYHLQNKSVDSLKGTQKSYQVHWKNTVKIGCSEFNEEDLRKVINTYKEINKI